MKFRNLNDRLEDLPGYAPESLKIADKIIKCLFIGLAVPAVLMSPFAGYELVKGGVRYLFRKSDLHREIKRLEKRGYVALTKTSDGWLIKLLKKAKMRRQRALLTDCHVLPKEKKWDKKWRFFFFDIPEQQRFGRDILRDKLKSLGMYNIQRSVFAYPFDCRKELESISEILDLAKYVTYSEVVYSDIDKELKKHFKKILR